MSATTPHKPGKSTDSAPPAVADATTRSHLDQLTGPKMAPEKQVELLEKLDAKEAEKAAAGAAPAKNGKEHVDEKETKGGIVYHHLNYTALGYFVNLFSSIAIADFFLDGKGRKWLEKATEATDKAVVSKLAGANSRSISWNIWKTLALTSGGTLLMWPIMKLENNKRRVVHQFNRWMGTEEPGLSPPPNVPIKDIPTDQLPPVAEEPPHQKIGGVAWRRLLSVFAVIGSSTALDRIIGNKRIEDAGTKVIIDAMEGSGSKAITKLASKPWFQRYTKLFVLDSVFTAITAAVIYATVPPEEGAKKPDKLGNKPSEAVEKALQGHVVSNISHEEEPAHADKAHTKHADKVEPKSKHSKHLSKHDSHASRAESHDSGPVLSA